MCWNSGGSSKTRYINSWHSNYGQWIQNKPACWRYNAYIGRYKVLFRKILCTVLLNFFAKFSGLKSVNYEKTEALWIGSFKNRTDKLAINQNIKWSVRKVKSLGVWFSSSKEEAVVLNYQEKKEKISKILSCWLLRRLILLGKVTVIKSLAASHLVYIHLCHLRNLIWKKYINFCQEKMRGCKRG